MKVFSDWLGLDLALVAAPSAVIVTGSMLLILAGWMAFLTFVSRRLASLVECGRLRFPKESLHIGNVQAGVVRDVFTHLGDSVVIHHVIIRRVSTRWQVIFIHFSAGASRKNRLRNSHSGWVTAVPQCCDPEKIRFHRTAFGAAMELITKVGDTRPLAF